MANGKVVVRLDDVSLQAVIKGVSAWEGSTLGSPLVAFLLAGGLEVITTIIQQLREPSCPLPIKLAIWKLGFNKVTRQPRRVRLFSVLYGARCRSVAVP